MRIRVLGQYLHMAIVALVVFESAMLFLLLPAVSYLRLPVDAQTGFLAHLQPLSAIAAVFSLSLVISVFSFGLYSARQRARTSGLAVRILFAVAAGTAFSSLVFYFVPRLHIDPTSLGLAALGALVVIALSRAGFYGLVDESLFKRRVLVYGAGRNATRISRLRRRSDRRGFTLIGFVQPPGESCEVNLDQVLRPTGSLAQLCAEHDIDEIVVAMDERRLGFPILELLECRLAGIDILEVLTFLERETGRVRIDVLNPSWLIFGAGFRRDTARLLSARALDLVASSVILLVALPLMVVTALAIKLEDGVRAPIFYAQRRVGLGGRVFNVLKFRSMRTDAERHGAQWATKGDARVTRVGGFIRKCRIDELPQILCVFRGHMSFVGPRPERPEFVAELSEKIPYYFQRHCVKPGITGWAQLCYPYGSSEQDALEKLQYDLYYIKNNTLLFDLAILLQTVEVVFMGQGAR